MGEVDFAKLSEQYASFLVAAGGVGITVLTLVLGLSSEPTNENEKQLVLRAQLFLVAALVVATISCFVGAHMMAETAAYYTHLGKPAEPLPDVIQLGRRLFVLASSNIFITIVLVLFSIILLPTATGKVELATKLKHLFRMAFLGILPGALLWMALAAIDRTGVGKYGWLAIAIALVVGISIGIYCCKYKEPSPRYIFIFIVAYIAISLIYFAIIFNVGKDCSKWRGVIEVGLFSLGITISYALLVWAHFKIPMTCSQTTQ
jgi:hypothetical protein